MEKEEWYLQTSINYHSGSSWLSQLYINTEIVYSLFPRSIVLFYSIANRKMKSLHTRNMALYPRGLFHHYSNIVIFLQSVCLLVRQALPQSLRILKLTGCSYSVCSLFLLQIFISLSIYLFICVQMCCLCVCVYAKCMLASHRGQKGPSRSPRTRVMDSCRLSCDPWGPRLAWQQVLLAPEPSLQPLGFLSYNKITL